MPLACWKAGKGWKGRMEAEKMKNVLIIDGALNSRYEIYMIRDDMFKRLFGSGKEEIYLEELSEELQNDVNFWNGFYQIEVNKKEINGIHGILHTHPKFDSPFGIEEAAN